MVAPTLAKTSRACSTSAIALAYSQRFSRIVARIKRLTARS
jgi:hypothetical protein